MLVQRQEQVSEPQLDRATVRLEQAAEGANGLGIEAGFGPGGSGGVQIAAGQCQPQEALALRQEPVEVVGELGRVDDPEQLEIVVGEHDAVVRRAPTGMAAAWRRVEP